MNNPGKALRDAYMSALQGLTYNGNAVTVFDNMPIETTPDRYVYINSIDYNQTGNNQLFVHTGVVTLDVIVKQYKKINLDEIDDIALSVQNKILPTVTNQITESNYQFIGINIESARYLTEQDGAFFLVRKIIRFSQTLINK